MNHEDIRALWKEALDEYLYKAQSGSVPTSVEDRLTELEKKLLDNPPPGKGKGLLSPPEKVEGINQVTPEQAGLQTVDIEKWPELIAEKNALKAWPSDHVYHVLDQKSVGSCASEAKDGAMMLVREISNQKRVVFNPYATYGRVNGGRDGGSYLHTNIAFAQRYGCFPEEIWPRSYGWRPNPSAEAYEAAANYKLREVVTLRNVTEFGSALLRGLPVYFGYPGHAIVGVKLVDSNRLWYLNSWGDDFGVNGMATLSFSSVAWSYGAYAFLSETWAGT